MLLPPRGQALLRAQHHLLLPLGLIYREHLQESVMGKGEMSSDNPNMQKVLCRLGLINFTNKGKKKNKKPSSSGGKSQCNSAERWAAGGLVAPALRVLIAMLSCRLSCRCG